MCACIYSQCSSCVSTHLALIILSPPANNHTYQLYTPPHPTTRSTEEPVPHWLNRMAGGVESAINTYRAASLSMQSLSDTLHQSWRWMAGGATHAQLHSSKSTPVLPGPRHGGSGHVGGGAHMTCPPRTAQDALLDGTIGVDTVHEGRQYEEEEEDGGHVQKQRRDEKPGVYDEKPGVCDEKPGVCDGNGATRGDGSSRREHDAGHAHRRMLMGIARQHRLSHTSSAPQLRSAVDEEH